MIYTKYFSLLDTNNNNLLVNSIVAPVFLVRSMRAWVGVRITTPPIFNTTVETRRGGRGARLVESSVRKRRGGFYLVVFLI